jgi:hypothetical protein
MQRIVQPELLDELAPCDRDAARSRGDLRRLNGWMGHARILARELGAAWDGRPGRRLIELGAGDGHLLSRVAQCMNGAARDVRAVLVDRLEVFDPETRGRFDRLGWRVEVETAEAIHWLGQAPAGMADAILGNLLLHHFSREQIGELFYQASRLAPLFIALEPRRASWPLFCSRRLRLLGCGPVTCHDGPISVQAGFRDQELSALWPGLPGWKLIERPVGWFSHLFIASKRAEPGVT